MSAKQASASEARFGLGWLLVVALTMFAIAPLAYPGFIETHSGFLPAFNVENLSEAPHWGRVPDSVRSEGKLPYLIAWPFLAISGSGVVAIRWGYALAFLLGALGIYAWIRPWLGLKGAVLAATVHTYLPWHLATVYVRGAYAEAWLWALWPLLMWAFDRLGERRLIAAVIVGVPAMLATLWVQPGLAILALPLLVAYALLVPLRRLWPVPLVMAILVVPLLLLWFIAGRIPPARLPFADHFLYPFQLLSAAWDEGQFFQLGFAAVGLTIVAVAMWIFKRSELAAGATESIYADPLPGRALSFWVGSLLILAGLTLSPFAFVWEWTGFDAFLTYPWQVLALSGLPLAFLAGSVVRLDVRLATWPAWAGLVALAMLASYPYLAPRFTQVDPGPEPVALFQPVEAAAPQILLLDADIAPPTAITPTLTVTLTWQAVEPVAGDYTVFVHVLTEDGTKAAQRDARPCEGLCPTNAWQPGEIIEDRYQLNLSAASSPPVSGDEPLAPYRLALGLYLLETGDRASIVGRDDGTVYLHVP